MANLASKLEQLQLDRKCSIDLCYKGIRSMNSYMNAHDLDRARNEKHALEQRFKALAVIWRNLDVALHENSSVPRSLIQHIDADNEVVFRDVVSAISQCKKYLQDNADDCDDDDVSTLRGGMRQLRLSKNQTYPSNATLTPDTRDARTLRLRKYSENRDKALALEAKAKEAERAELSLQKQWLKVSDERSRLEHELSQIRKEESYKTSDEYYDDDADPYVFTRKPPSSRGNEFEYPIKGATFVKREPELPSFVKRDPERPSSIVDDMFYQSSPLCDRGFSRDDFYGNGYAEVPIRDGERRRVKFDFDASRDDLYGNGYAEVNRGDARPIREGERRRDNFDFDPPREVFRSRDESVGIDMQQMLLQSTLLPKLDALKFNGDPLEFLTFRSNFEQTVMNVTNDPSVRMNHLIARCTGKAANIIKRKVLIRPPERGFEQAMAALDREFGQRDALVRSARNELNRGGVIDGSHDSLLSLISDMENLRDVMDAGNCLYELDSVSITSMIFKRFTRQMRDNFENQQAARIASNFHGNIKVTFDDLMNFVKAKSYYTLTSFSHMTRDNSRSSGGFANVKQNKPRAYVNLAQGQGKRTPYCAYCKSENHWLTKCERLLSKTLEERRNIFMEKHWCFACAGSGHGSASCQSKRRCATCGRKHHVLLCSVEYNRKHGESPPAEQRPAATVAAVNTDKMSAGSGSAFPKVVIPVLSIGVGDDKKSLSVNCFLDGGSTMSFVSTRIKNRVDPKTMTKVKMTVNGINSTKTLSGYCFPLVLSGLIPECGKIYANKVYWFVDLPLPKLSECVPSSILKNVDVGPDRCLFPDVGNTDIDILIGRDIPSAHKVIRERQWEGTRGLTASLTCLGWYFSGPEKATANCFSINDAYVASCKGESKLDELNDRLQHMSMLEFSDLAYSNKFGLSVNDKLCEKIIRDTTSVVDGRYVTGLPWKDGVSFKDNRYQAEKRALSLRPKFESNSEFHVKFVEKMTTVVNEHSERVTREMNLAAKPGSINFITYFAVNPILGKFRVVWDAALKCFGLSLNDRLYPGGHNMSNLVSVLLKSRQYKVLFTADIKGMFNCIGIQESDRDSLRFLWYPDGDYTKDLVEYRWTKWCFGLAPAPQAANQVLCDVANENAIGVSVETVQVVFNNRFVDDFLPSFKSVTQAVKVRSELDALLRNRMLELSKYNSTHPEVLENVPDCDISSSVKCLDSELLKTGKLLGVNLDFDKDCYFFNVGDVTEPATKSGILSCYSKLFDPLGFICIFILPMKLLQQECNKLGLGWNDPLPDDLKSIWDSWKDNLYKLRDVYVPRCLIPDADNYTSVELHVFCDASATGYGCGVYIRVTYDDHVWVTLVMGKSRVCPLKKLTIARLELCAALSGVRTANVVTGSLEEDLRVVFWSDSKSAIQMIRNKDRRFNVFVAVRLEEIHESSTIDQWRHCPGKLNSADFPSRGLMPQQCERAACWFNGPSFLREGEDMWPTSDFDGSGVSELVQQEIKVLQAVAEEPVECAGIAHMINFFDCLWKLIRSVAWLLRYVRYVVAGSNRQELKRSMESKKISMEYLTVNETLSAESLIIRNVQKEHFAELYVALTDYPDFESALRADHVVVKQTSLRKLNPIKVNGIIRVGGRLLHAPIANDVKHPIILPSNSNLTYLIIDYYHNVMAHLGGHQVLACTREKYWIVHGLRTIKARLLNCVKCKRWKSAGEQQVMSDLPSCRLISNRTVFHSTAVDLCGPFFVKRGRALVKRWVCLFNCCASRCSHLEVVHALTTDSFIKALLRFMCTRSVKVHEFVSDQGSNFTSADAELRKFFSTINNEQVNRELLKKGVQWNFNPASSPHRGGVYERQFRVFKKCLFSCTNDTTLNDEDFLTVIVQIQAILNSRPIVKLSADPNDVKALTPNQLLGGCLTDGLPSSDFIGIDGYRRSWSNIKLVLDNWWTRWSKEYLTTLQARQKWLKPVRNLQTGDLVLIITENVKRGQWPLGLITKTFPDSLGRVRTVEVKTSKGLVLSRDCRKLVLLEGAV